MFSNLIDITQSFFVTNNHDNNLVEAYNHLPSTRLGDVNVEPALT